MNHLLVEPTKYPKVDCHLTDTSRACGRRLAAQSDMASVDPRLEAEYKAMMAAHMNSSSISAPQDRPRRLLGPNDPYASTVGEDELVSNCSVRQRDGTTWCRVSDDGTGAGLQQQQEKQQQEQRRRRLRRRRRRRRRRHHKSRQASAPGKLIKITGILGTMIIAVRNERDEGEIVSSVYQSAEVIVVLDSSGIFSRIELFRKFGGRSIMGKKKKVLRVYRTRERGYAFICFLVIRIDFMDITGGSAFEEAVSEIDAPLIVSGSGRSLPELDLDIATEISFFSLLAAVEENYTSIGQSVVRRVHDDHPTAA
ncbi:unnamed protein product [Notodromas monacha]|uniref:Uncharacterized protein n=1 Tax=Notodromas monacha TaxID=399045 RepID=A0A7R9BHG2_9CRUS|nr:unnamed protein product [Notodromas monacha]CAG0913991.1 unnamed protein product [Notodromas monacha]